MAELKPGWQRVKFGQLAECINDRVDDPASAGVDRYVGLEHLDPDSLMIRRWGSPSDVESTKLRFKPGDIIFGKRRAYQRKLAVANFEGICSAHAMVLRAKPEVVLPEFLPFFMQSDLFMKRAVEISVGSLSPTINWKTLAQEEFLLPPLEEQRRIARLLTAVEHSLQCITRGSRLAFDMSRRLLEAFDLMKLPFVLVKDLVTEGPSNGVSPRCNDQGIGRPTLPVGCVYSGVVNTRSELKYSQIDDQTFARYQLHRDDILVVRGNGNRELVGRAGIVTEQASKCFYPDLLIRLRFDPAKLDPSLAALLWNCVPIHAALAGRSKSTNGIYKINGSDIREHCLPLPSWKMQLEMLDAVAAHAETLKSMTSRVTQCSHMKSRLLASLNGIV